MVVNLKGLSVIQSRPGRVSLLLSPGACFTPAFPPLHTPTPVQDGSVPQVHSLSSSTQPLSEPNSDGVHKRGHARAPLEGNAQPGYSETAFGYLAIKFHLNWGGSRNTGANLSPHCLSALPACPWPITCHFQEVGDFLVFCSLKYPLLGVSYFHLLF